VPSPCASPTSAGNSAKSSASRWASTSTTRLDRADPTGLFTINSSLIGYQNIYGNDVIGGALIFGKKDVPITGELHITNGYFDGADAFSRGAQAFNGSGAVGASATRENHDLGFGLDLTYTFAKGNVNLESPMIRMAAADCPSTWSTVRVLARLPADWEAIPSWSASTPR